MSGQLWTNCKIFRTSSNEFQTLTSEDSGLQTKSDELQFRPDKLERNYCNLNPAVRRPSADEFGDVSKSSGSIPKNCKLVRTSKIEIRKTVNSSGRVRTNCKLVRARPGKFEKIAISSGRLPCKNANSNPPVDGQRMNSDKLQTRAEEFGRGRVIKRVLKKKIKLVRSIAIASGRVRTSCNFHTVRRPSLRSPDEF